MIGHYEAARSPRMRLYASVAAVPILAIFVGVSGHGAEVDNVAIALALGLWAALGITVDARRIAEGRLPMGIPAIVVVLPFFHILLPWGAWGHVFQAGVVALLVLYLSLLSPRLRVASVRRSIPLLVPVLLLVGTVILSYSLSPHLSRHDILGLADLTAAAAFVPLAAFYCRSLRDLERLLFAFILGGMLQLPIVVGQAAGLMDSLPGGLSQLSPAGWGGSLAEHAVGAGGGAIVARYPGSFGSAENFAEYCGILVLLCLGLCLFEPRRMRALAFGAAAAAAGAMGWFSGTRSFVLGVGGGVAILLFGALILSGRKVTRLMRLAEAVVLGAVVVLWLVPGSITAGFLSRFGSSELSLSGPNAFDRLGLFRTWVSLVRDMPVFGYGPGMSRAIGASYPNWIIHWPHSLYFWALLTSGFLGLAALCVVMAVVVYLPIRTAALRSTSRYRQLGCVFAAVTIYLAANEAKIEFVRLTFYIDMVFLLFGAIASLYVLSREADQVPGQAPGGSATGAVQAMRSGVRD